jgi:ABC-type Mn2+/Zn2+ transport system permease subunit
MTLVEMFSNPYLTKIILKALVVGVLVSLCASMLGVSLVLKRFSMIGDGLSHVGFFALAVATVLKMSDFAIEISIPIVIFAAFLIFWIKEHSKIKGDAAIAMISTGSIAAGSLIFNFSGSRSTDVCNSLFGSSSIITLTDKELIISIVLSVVCILMFLLSYSKIFTITFDETFARATGIKTSAYNLMIAVLTAVTIVVGMEMIGAIMISALVIFPALTSMRLFNSFRGVVICSAVVGVICFLMGFFAACRLSLQTGATVVAFHVVTFIVFSLIGFFAANKIGRRKIT